MTAPSAGPDLIATLDQMKAGLGTMASVSASYYGDLIAAGCPKRLARQLVRDLHRIIMGGAAVPPVVEEDERGEDEKVVWRSLTPDRISEPIHRGRDESGCPVCGVIDLEPCVMGGGG